MVKIALTVRFVGFFACAFVQDFWNCECILHNFFFSGQAAVITPRQVSSGLGARRVKTIAAAKHHTVAATQRGEVFTWGSNRGELIGISYEIEIID